MPTTLVAVGVAALLAAALLDERAFSGRAVVVVLAAAAAPDLDALLGVIDPGLHNAALHNVWIPLTAAVAVRMDRRTGWLRRRFGPTAAAVAWVTIAAYTVAIAFDLFNIESAAVLWPVHDRFFAIVGKVAYSTTNGVEITLVQPRFDGGPLLPGASYGTVSGSYRVPSVVAPKDGTPRSVTAINAGWELLCLLAGGVVAGGRVRAAGAADPETTVQPAEGD